MFFNKWKRMYEKVLIQVDEKNKEIEKLEKNNDLKSSMVYESNLKLCKAEKQIRKFSEDQLILAMENIRLGDALDVANKKIDELNESLKKANGSIGGLTAKYNKLKANSYEYTRLPGTKPTKQVTKLKNKITKNEVKNILKERNGNNG